MKSSRLAIAAAAIALAILGREARQAQAAVPGLFYPVMTAPSDNKLGSVLVYNFYTSNALDPAGENTRISLTNHSDRNSTFVRLFLVEGSSGIPANLFVALKANQTVSFLASEIDPGVTGFILAVAVDGVTGCPAASNTLGGRVTIKTPTTGARFPGGMNAVAFSARYSGVMPGCDANSTTATLEFNGFAYDPMPRRLEGDSMGSQIDGDRTLLVLSRMAGVFTSTNAAIVSYEGAVFSANGKRFPFTRSAGPQIAQVFKKGFPTGKFKRAIPAGKTGWLELNGVSDIGLAGALLFNAPGGAVNLRVETLTSAATFTIPVDPPAF